jgi:hypothetical protein
LNWFAKRKARRVLEENGYCPVHGTKREIFKPLYGYRKRYMPRFEECVDCNAAKKLETEVAVGWALWELGFAALAGIRKGRAMKILGSLILILASAIGNAQTWLSIATLSDQQNPLVTSNGPVTYRYGIDSGVTNAGVDCSIAPNCWLAPKTATLTNFPTLWSTFPSDPAPGVSKQFEIAETCAQQTGTIGGVAYSIPALPAASCTFQAAFTPSVSYTMSVMNIPPLTPTSPLQMQLTIGIGSQSVSFTCSYGTTLANTATTPTAMQAVFNCVAQAPVSQ